MKSILNKSQGFWLFELIVCLALLACSELNASAAPLKAGDIIYADSGNAIEGGFIIKVDPNTGQQTVIASGGNLSGPFDVTIDDNGQIIASVEGRLVRI